MGDSLYFYIFVSFFCIFVFFNYLARVGRWVMVRRVTPRSFAAWAERILFNHDYIVFFYQLLALVPPWLNIVHKYTCDIFDQSLSILGRQKEFNTRDTITSERFRQRIGISKLFALNTCCTLCSAQCTFKSAKKQAIELHQPPALLTKSNPDSGWVGRAASQAQIPSYL